MRSVLSVYEGRAGREWLESWGKYSSFILTTVLNRLDDILGEFEFTERSTTWKDSLLFVMVILS